MFVIMDIISSVSAAVMSSRSGAFVSGAAIKAGSSSRNNKTCSAAMQDAPKVRYRSIVREETA